MKTAQVRLTPRGRYVVMLSDGQRIEHGEMVDLAAALLAATTCARMAGY